MNPHAEILLIHLVRSIAIIPFFTIGQSYDYPSCRLFWQNKWFRLLLTTEIWIIISSITSHPSVGFDFFNSFSICGNHLQKNKSGANRAKLRIYLLVSYVYPTTQYCWICNPGVFYLQSMR